MLTLWLTKRRAMIETRKAAEVPETGYACSWVLRPSIRPQFRSADVAIDRSCDHGGFCRFRSSRPGS